MSEIKRYDVLTEPGGEFGYAQEDEEGIWVEYDHHESALTQARAEMKERCTQEIFDESCERIGARIRELEAQHGSLRAAARALNCDAAYLLRLRDGEKHNPSAAMLRKLGLKKVVTYERD